MQRWTDDEIAETDSLEATLPKDDAIDEIATQAPTDLDGLNRLRSVPKGFGGSRFGAELMEAIKQGLADPEGYAPKIERSGGPAPVPSLCGGRTRRPDRLHNRLGRTGPRQGQG